MNAPPSVGDDPMGGRRRFLASAGAAVAAGIAGCSNPFAEPERDAGEVSLADFRGSGPLVESRGTYEGTSIEDLPDLAGTLRIYLGGGEGGLYTGLLDIFRRRYPEFQPEVRDAPSAQLANTIIEEAQGGSTSADVFWSVDAGSLGVVADNGLYEPLPADVVESVPATYHPDDRWVGVAGRARAVPYNTAELGEDDIPAEVEAFPSTEPFRDAIGWAPNYGAFQAFVTAMRVLRGEAETREWLESMIDLGATQYSNEFFVSNAVADGEIVAGFANHYYALRVQSSRPDAPIDLAFTRGDAGALVNVSGVGVLADSERRDLATDFAHHLLTVEAQEYFATRAFSYPTVTGIPPVGGLPTIDELDPPDLDLSTLADLEPTLDLMRDVGLL